MKLFVAPNYETPKPPDRRDEERKMLFYQQSFKIQCFIYAKYTLGWPKRWIKRFLFLRTDTTYYKYDLLVKTLFNL